MFKRLSIAIIAMLMSLAAFAQAGLNIGRYFDDEYLSKLGITSVSISGSQLKNWNRDISLYRSVTIENNTTDVDQMELAVKKDGVRAVSRTVFMNNGHVVFGFYTMSPVNGVNRYIIFIRNDSNKTPGSTTDMRADLFYIEGKVSTEELSKMIRSVKTSK